MHRETVDNLCYHRDNKLIHPCFLQVSKTDQWESTASKWGERAVLFFFCLLHLTISLLRFMIGISTLQPYNHYSRMSLEIMEGKDSPKNNKKIPKESSKAKAAYYIYESLGLDRSISKVAQQMGHPYPGYERHLEEWSRLYGWVERARKWDDEQLERKRIERQKQIDEMNKRHIKLAIKQQENAIEVIERLKSIKGRGGLGSIAAVNLLKLAIDLERLANDAATEQIALTGNKNADPVDIIVETFWGRGTDPRKSEQSEELTETGIETNEEDAELTVEIDTEDEE